MKTAQALGERKIIESIWKCQTDHRRLPIPFGDDVSAIKCKECDLTVLKTDMLVGETDIPPGMNKWQAARKAVVMNVSDFAAKGVKPLGALVSLGLPRNMKEEDIIQIGKGLHAGAIEYGAQILGGDTNETKDLIIGVFIAGFADKGQLVLRSGARPGDIVATTGPFGAAAAGLKHLIEKLEAPSQIRKKLIEAVLLPKAKLKEGFTLAQTGAATASIDSSDGLAWSLHEISNASGVGFEIKNLPIADEAHAFGRMHNLDPSELALYGGEEYELVITVKPNQWNHVCEKVKRSGGNLLRIGEVTVEKNILLQKKDELIEIEARGYEHFKQRKT